MSNSFSSGLPIRALPTSQKYCFRQSLDPLLNLKHVQISGLCLEIFFVFFLRHPPPPGTPGEGPDGHFSWELGGFQPAPARAREGQKYLLFSFLP